MPMGQIRSSRTARGAVIAVALAALFLTGCQSFVPREQPGDLRVVSYNVLWNTIFEDISPDGAAKFARVVRALDPDILAIQEIGATSWMRDEDPNVRDWNAADVAALMDEVHPLAAGRHWHTHKGSDNVIISKYPLEMRRTGTIPRGDRDQAIALVDLPDDRFAFDFYVMNNHYKCCGGYDNDPRRQKQSDAIIAWIRDARTPGGEIDLPPGTAIAVLGDLNIVGGFQPVQTLIDGDIVDEGAFGADCPPDWDDTEMVDAHPMHNVRGPEDYTWRNDNDRWEAGRLDYIVFTDSMLRPVKRFVLNTTMMSDAELKQAGLKRYDICVDDEGREFDHLPLVVDLRPR
jgi:endonuclease/exonuclease/phosphatase family metal-dependent hydrolase